MGHQLKMAKLTYACVLTQQIDRLTSFYQDALDLAPRREEAYVEFSTEPGIFCLWALDAYAEIAGSNEVPQPGAGGIMLEFQVDNVDMEFARLKALSRLSIEFIIPPTTMAWETGQFTSVTPMATSSISSVLAPEGHSRPLHS